MSWLSSFLSPGKGYDKAQQQMQQYYNQAQGMQQPFMQQGMQAGNQLSDAMKNLLNPQNLQNQWAAGYQESPYAKQLEGMAQEHGLDAASSMGLMGSSPALGAIQAGTTQIGNEDRQNYLNDLMQKYLAGTGIGQNMFGTGANMAGQMGNQAMQMGDWMGTNAANKQNAGGNMMGSLLGGIGSIAGSALGGPIGGALANKMGWSTTGGK